MTNCDTSEFWIFERQRLYRGPHLLRRCFELTTINHLQESKCIDVFGQCRLSLLRFYLIQNRDYSS